MPRFIPEKWKPEHDSSPGVFQEDPSCVVLLQYGDGCPCGCGMRPEGKKATFRMGHDARLRGILIRAHLMGVQVRYMLEGKTLVGPTSAAELADQFEWREYLENAVLRREGKNRELLQRALKDPNLLKAGKWDYTGGQVVVMYKPNPRTQMMDIEYVNQAGEIRKSRLPAESVEETVK